MDKNTKQLLWTLGSSPLALTSVSAPTSMILSARLRRRTGEQEGQSPS